MGVLQPGGQLLPSLEWDQTNLQSVAYLSYMTSSSAGMLTFATSNSEIKGDGNQSAFSIQFHNRLAQYKILMPTSLHKSGGYASTDVSRHLDLEQAHLLHRSLESCSHRCPSPSSPLRTSGKQHVISDFSSLGILGQEREATALITIGGGCFALQQQRAPASCHLTESLMSKYRLLSKFAKSVYVNSYTSCHVVWRRESK
jgi:hypothetical protein